MHIVCVSGAHRSQKTVLDPMEVLGIDPGSAVRTRNALNHCAISPAVLLSPASVESEVESAQYVTIKRIFCSQDMLRKCKAIHASPSHVLALQRVRKTRSEEV